MYMDKVWSFSALMNEPLEYHSKEAIGMTYYILEYEKCKEGIFEGYERLLWHRV